MIEKSKKEISANQKVNTPKKYLSDDKSNELLLDKFFREYGIYQIENYNKKWNNEMSQEDLCKFYIFILKSKNANSSRFFSRCKNKQSGKKRTFHRVQ